MRRFNKQIFAVAFVISLCTCAALAKEDAHEMISKSFQQADLWTQPTVKLVADVRLPQPSGDISVTYTVSWAGPDKWRAEWGAQGLQDITVQNGGKLSYITNQKGPIVWAILFQEALAALDGGNPAGPYTDAPPMDWQKAKLEITKKKVGTIDAHCVVIGQPPAEVLCFDPANSHLLTADADFTTFEYGDYVTVGGNSYPQSVKVSFNKQLLVEGKVTVTRGDKLADNLFTPPDKSTTTDLATCADVDKNYTAPHLDKTVPAKMPDAAKKAKKYGVVWVIADENKSGGVQKAVVAGGDPDLTAAATDAVQQYKFTPYMRCGQAVEFQKLVLVPFAPSQGPAQQPADFSGGRH